MSDFRFAIGTKVMCNLGQRGWKLGRVIALRYREDHWPAGETAPYQVALEEDHALIYVPEDDPRLCREPTPEDLRIARRMDALAPLPDAPESSRAAPDETTDPGTQLDCAEEMGHTDHGYRKGRCHGCHCCPRRWSSVELYSEHYRCAARNRLKVTRRTFDLGTYRVGDVVHHPDPSDQGGYGQCPTLVRLPPGVRFSDNGSLTGEVRFDPHRDGSYRVEFVAVSTAHWDTPSVGVVRLEISFTVEGNLPPASFDVDSFRREQDRARTEAKIMVRDLVNTWLEWEEGDLSIRDTCDRMGADLRRLRKLLEQHPRLDGGRWWAQLGGFHMNVHKLLENTLFECELYLGYALTFGDVEVRQLAEQNLEGCYQKRLLEAARFMWMDGLEQMMRGEWAAAAETLRRAAAKKDGWGWAVNYGDIWLSESAARLVHGAELSGMDGSRASQERPWIREAARLLQQAAERAGESRAFGPEGHPWAAEIKASLAAYRSLRDRDADVAGWLEAFKLRTAYWCAQVLGGAPPFPPKPRARLEEAALLKQRLPGHNH